MADTKVTAFPASAGLSLTDIFPVVDDPGGTPITQKATFTQLQTLLGTGNFVLKAGDTMTGALVHPVGSAAAPSITFTGDLDTGIYHNGPDQINITTGGLQSVAVTPSLAFFFADLTAASGLVTLSGGATFQSSGIIFSLTNFTVTGYDSNLDEFAVAAFHGGSPSPSVGVAGYIGFFAAALAPVVRQSAPGNTLAEVLTALRAYGLLAP